MDSLMGEYLGVVAYPDALEIQHQSRDRVAGDGESAHRLLLLEHPPVFTLGKRGGEGLMLTPREELVTLGAEVVQTDRGGLVTFHGPGQLVGYPILHLERLKLSLKDYVRKLMTVLCDELRAEDIDARVDMDNPGVYVAGRKIGAVGVRLTRGVTTHGFALNLTTDLSWFEHIIACGLRGVSATSVLQEKGRSPSTQTMGHRIGRRLAERLGLKYTVKIDVESRA